MEVVWQGGGMGKTTDAEFEVIDTVAWRADALTLAGSVAVFGAVVLLVWLTDQTGPLYLGAGIAAIGAGGRAIWRLRFTLRGRSPPDEASRAAALEDRIRNRTRPRRTGRKGEFSPKPVALITDSSQRPE